MKQKVVEEQLDFYINEVKKKYDDIYIDYYYVSSIKGYAIWHNRVDLEYNNEEFRKFTGKLLYDLFFSKEFYNVYISYDHEKAKKKLYMKSISKITKDGDKELIQSILPVESISSISTLKFKEESKQVSTWSTSFANTLYENSHYKSTFQTEIDHQNIADNCNRYSKDDFVSSKAA